MGHECVRLEKELTIWYRHDFVMNFSCFASFVHFPLTCGQFGITEVCHDGFTEKSRVLRHNRNIFAKTRTVSFMILT